MASLNTSELQFAFIFFMKFNELNNYRFNHVFVPTQRQEGDKSNPSNGTDIVLDEYFLQFKMSNFINWRRGSGNLQVPYFKFKVYNSPKFNPKTGQLDFLKIHAKDSRKKVYYVAPCYGTKYSYDTDDVDFWCDNFYKSNPAEIGDFSTFIVIKSIKNAWIENNNRHSICYNHKGGAYFLSEPKMVEMLVPSILNEEDLYSNISGDSLDDIIKIRLEEIKGMTFEGFFEANYIDIHKVTLFDLQEIYLTFFDTFWIPILISKTKLLGMKLNKIQSLIKNSNV